MVTLGECWQGCAVPTFFAACAPKVERLLLEEVRRLGPTEAKLVPGGVEMEGSLTLLARANLELGLALFVLERLSTFRAGFFDALVRGAGRVEWARLIPNGARVRVTATCKRSRLYHSGAVVERVREAIAAGVSVRDPEPGEDALEIEARIVDDVCTLSVDTSGAPLYRRGYRLATGKAPLREDLARAAILISGWDAATPLADPFAGSGTIPIEAALLARGIPPGARRTFAFENFAEHDPRTIRKLRETSLYSSLPRAPSPIFGSDRDSGAVEAALANAERAGVAEDIRFDEAPMGRAPFMIEAPPDGAWVCNPPFGRRVGKGRDLRPLYQSIGQRASQLPPGWTVTLISADPRLTRATGLPLKARLATDHGGIPIKIMSTGSPASATAQPEIES